MGSLWFGDKFKIIGYWAFDGDDGITEVYIGSDVYSVGIGAFNDCQNLVRFRVNAGNSCYSEQDGVLYNQNKSILVQYPAAKTGDYSIPDSVYEIRYYAFSNCTRLTGITIGSGVGAIEHSAFQGLIALDGNVVIPDPLRISATRLFSGCESLTGRVIGKGITEIRSNFCELYNPSFRLQ
jgi:hypothetical protein